MPELNLDQQYLIRKKSPFLNYPRYGTKFNKSFFPHFLNSYNNLPNTIKGLGLKDFKDQLSSLIKPKKYKHFSRGSKLGNTLLTRIRVGRSKLNSHTYMISLSDNPSCDCLHRNETSLHYFLKCNK